MKLVLTRPWGGVHGSARGTEVDVDESVGDWLKRVGGAVSPGGLDKPSPKPTPRPKSKPTPKPSVKKSKTVKTPSKAAPIDSWRAWAKESGYDPKGLSKQEIIALSR